MKFDKTILSGEGIFQLDYLSTNFVYLRVVNTINHDNHNNKRKQQASKSRNRDA